MNVYWIELVWLDIKSNHPIIIIILSSQAFILTGHSHCALTGHYFEPWKKMPQKFTSQNLLNILFETCLLGVHKAAPRNTYLCLDSIVLFHQALVIKLKVFNGTYKLTRPVDKQKDKLTWCSFSLLTYQ